MASPKDVDSDGSLTPSETSDADERSDRDSDYETEEDDKISSKSSLNIQWTGYSKKTPIILFNTECVFNKRVSMRTVGERYHMAYKFGNSECKIVRTIFNSHGFHEVHPNSSDYNLVWTGAHLKPFTLRSLSEFQKINHFPRSYELTRKDRLWKNIQRMQQIKGAKNFDIIPTSYVLPGEYQEFCSAFLKDKGPWIVKPVASSRGRGIFLVNHPDQIPLDENVIVCRYVPNPLLIDGFKFDIRLYVAVTSYDPLQIYLFEEGLTRFATVKYEKAGRHIRNQCMHLTNYSVNKKNDEYVRNDDADVEDYGNKWSLGAMLRYLRSNGKDTAALMMKIEDVIIKTILSVELPIATACKMFMPFRGNCFELYGFDILLDDNLKPWVLEVNLSPSLACDSPLDLKIKGNMLSDLFSMTGIVCHDPMMRTMQQSRRNMDVANKMAARAKSARVRANPSIVKQRPSSAGSMKKGSDGRDSQSSTNKAMSGLNSEEIRVVRRAKEEDSRKGGWVRIFPTADSWDLYSSFLQFTTSHNLMLHQKLYPDRHKSTSTATVSRGSTSQGTRAKSAYIQLANNTNSVKPTLELAAAYAQAIMRTKRYERKLGTKRGKAKRKKKTDSSRKDRAKLSQGVAEDSAEDGGEEDQEEDELPITERNISARGNHGDNLGAQKLEKQPQKLQNEEVIQIVVEKDAKKNSRSGGAGGGLASLSRHNPPADSGSAGGREDREEGRRGSEEKVPPPPSRSPSPTPPPLEPKYNVVELLQKGQTLNKVQARTAFAMYLVRVQQRLMSDSTTMTQDDVDGLNEQMDLVLRFLKRAAVNLQQSFKVVVPSRKLPINDRRRILAKQLGDFVHIYNKDYSLRSQSAETDQLRSRRTQERKHGMSQIRRTDSIDGLEEDKFDRFIHTASEGELEEVLTTYTKINKSASIFLGSKTGADPSNVNHVPTTGITSHNSNSMKHIGATSSLMRSESQNSLSRKKDGVQSESPQPPRVPTGWEDVPKAIISMPTSSSDLRPPPSQPHNSHHGNTAGHAPGPPTRTNPVTYNTNSAASYANAVQIYTQKLSTTLRPRSASSGAQKTEKQTLRSRPSSATVGRPSSAHNSQYGSSQDLQDENKKERNNSPKRSPILFSKHFARSSKDPYNEKVISDALSRLTMRQQARQYSAFNGTSLVPSDTGSRPTSASGHRDAMDASRAWTQLQHDGGHQGTSHHNGNNNHGNTGQHGVSQGHGAETVVVEKGGEDGHGGHIYPGGHSQAHTREYISVEDHISKQRPPSGHSQQKRTHSAIDYKSLESQRRKQSNINLQSANATFNSFIEDTGPNWQNELAMAYNQVTGVQPQNYRIASQSSKQYQIAQQQALKQQSKVLLEQSKAKHQAMIAQAHAVQKSLIRPDVDAAIQMYAPKPPVKPGLRKSASAQHRMPRRAAPEETSLNFQFQSSSKPAMNGGWESLH